MDIAYVVVLVVAGVVAFLGTHLLRRPVASLVMATALGPLYLAVVFASHETNPNGGASLTAIAFLTAAFFGAMAGAIGVVVATLFANREAKSAK